MTPEFVASQPTGSTAGTNAKQVLSMWMAKRTVIVCWIGFGVAVGLRMETLALGILGLLLSYLAAYQGLTTYQHKVDRDTDWTALGIKAGAPNPTVIKEVTKTTTQATSEKNTVAPPAEEPLG